MRSSPLRRRAGLLAASCLVALVALGVQRAAGEGVTPAVARERLARIMPLTPLPAPTYLWPELEVLGVSVLPSRDVCPGLDLPVVRSLQVSGAVLLPRLGSDVSLHFRQLLPLAEARWWRLVLRREGRRLRLWRRSLGGDSPGWVSPWGGPALPTADETGVGGVFLQSVALWTNASMRLPDGPVELLIEAPDPETKGARQRRPLVDLRVDRMEGALRWARQFLAAGCPEPALRVLEEASFGLGLRPAALPPAAAEILADLRQRPRFAARARALWALQALEAGQPAAAHKRLGETSGATWWLAVAGRVMRALGRDAVAARYERKVRAANLPWPPAWRAPTPAATQPPPVDLPPRFWTGEGPFVAQPQASVSITLPVLAAPARVHLRVEGQPAQGNPRVEIQLANLPPEVVELDEGPFTWEAHLPRGAPLWVTLRVSLINPFHWRNAIGRVTARGVRILGVRIEPFVEVD